MPQIRSGGRLEVMDDRGRRAALLEELRALEGVDEDLFRRLSGELERARREFGYDEKGRLEVAVFDARSYDVESFDACNAGRFNLHYVSAPLGVDTAASANGCRAIIRRSSRTWRGGASS
jgi:hypothetical protein